MGYRFELENRIWVKQITGKRLIIFGLAYCVEYNRFCKQINVHCCPIFQKSGNEISVHLFASFYSCFSVYKGARLFK